MPENKRIPDDLYALFYGEYAPRLCVDVIVIGPNDSHTVSVTPDVNLLFDIQGPDGIILAQRDILPEIGSWHLPGGTVRKEETLETAAKRIVRGEAGIDIDVIAIIGSMEFLKEDRDVDINGTIKKIGVHTVSVVLLAKAKTNALQGSADGKNIGWFKTVPPLGHTIHIPYLVQHGFLKK